MSQFTMQNFPLSAAFKFAIRIWAIAIFCTTILLIVGGFPLGWWMFVPFLTVSVASIAFGLFVFTVRLFFTKTKNNRTVINILSVLIFPIMIWISLVAAFSVTGFWN